MKHLIIVLITLFGITILLITLTGASEFNDIDGKVILSETTIKQQKLDVDYINFKSYTMNQIEKNNLDIIQITEDINQTERDIEEAKKRRITNLKQQNTQLSAGLNRYHTQNTGWESFKSNFNINFKRMGLPFSELFKDTGKK